MSLGPLFGLNFVQLFKLKSNVDLCLEASWDPLGGTSWEHAWQVVLTSIFDAFSMRLSIDFLIIVGAKMQF